MFIQSTQHILSSLEDHNDQLDPCESETLKQQIDSEQVKVGFRNIYKIIIKTQILKKWIDELESTGKFIVKKIIERD